VSEMGRPAGDALTGLVVFNAVNFVTRKLKKDGPSLGLTVMTPTPLSMDQEDFEVGTTIGRPSTFRLDSIRLGNILRLL
jgi:hypothetical protein